MNYWELAIKKLAAHRKVTTSLQKRILQFLTKTYYKWVTNYMPFFLHFTSNSLNNKFS